MAREVVEAAVTAARRLEDDFLRKKPRAVPPLNPVLDVGAALKFVQYAHKGLSEATTGGACRSHLA